MAEWVLVGALLQGNPLLKTSVHLVARFAVSRATDREALLKMQKSGWILLRSVTPPGSTFRSHVNLEQSSHIMRTAGAYRRSWRRTFSSRGPSLPGILRAVRWEMVRNSKPSTIAAQRDPGMVLTPCPMRRGTAPVRGDYARN